MGEHDHEEYASDRRDHREDYAEHGHNTGDAGRYHRRDDLENDDETAQRRITALQAEVDGLRAQLAGVLAQVRVLDRLRPTCVICRDATADRQTARGPACTDCAGDLPDEAAGPDPDRPDTWAFPEAKLNAPRIVSRTYWPVAVCEFITDDMCGAAAVARVTSLAEPSEHLWCCGPHRDHLLRISPDDAFVSWAKPGEPAPATLAEDYQRGQS